MAGDHAAELDETDWRLLTVLQRDARASFAELARHVAMSPSAVAERVRRLEETGVIAGYQAVVPPERVGLEVLAFVRLRYPTGNYRPFHALLDSTPEIIEAHHVTGEDCFVLKVVARSMRHLEAVTGRVAGLGAVTTSVVYSSPLLRRDLAVESLGDADGTTRRSGRRMASSRQSMAN
jgi:Lrp/AsnC family transcriptional regulator, leucine-responsive regulatory protein